MSKFSQTTVLHYWSCSHYNSLLLQYYRKARRLAIEKLIPEYNKRMRRPPSVTSIHMVQTLCVCIVCMYVCVCMHTLCMCIHVSCVLSVVCIQTICMLCVMCMCCVYTCVHNIVLCLLKL